MTTYRFPGRPRRNVEHRKRVFWYEPEVESEAVDDPRLAQLEYNVSKGLETFRAIVGDSSNEEEFEGFSATDIDESELTCRSLSVALLSLGGGRVQTSSGNRSDQSDRRKFYDYYNGKSNVGNHCLKTSGETATENHPTTTLINAADVMNCQTNFKISTQTSVSVSAGATANAFTHRTNKMSNSRDNVDDSGRESVVPSYLTFRPKGNEVRLLVPRYRQISDASCGQKMARTPLGITCGERPPSNGIKPLQNCTNILPDRQPINELQKATFEHTKVRLDNTSWFHKHKVHPSKLQPPRQHRQSLHTQQQNNDEAQQLLMLKPEIKLLIHKRECCVCGAKYQLIRHVGFVGLCCRSCVSFFRLIYHQQTRLQLVCHRSGHCPVQDSSQHDNCRACHYSRCLRFFNASTAASVEFYPPPTADVPQSHLSASNNVGLVHKINSSDDVTTWSNPDMADVGCSNENERRKPLILRGAYNPWKNLHGVKPGRGRKRRCQHCSGCLAQSCGKCSVCSTMIRFGGSTKTKQSCINHGNEIIVHVTCNRMRKCLHPCNPKPKEQAVLSVPPSLQPFLGSDNSTEGAHCADVACIESEWMLLLKHARRRNGLPFEDLEHSSRLSGGWRSISDIIDMCTALRPRQSETELDSQEDIVRQTDLFEILRRVVHSLMPKFDTNLVKAFTRQQKNRNEPGLVEHTDNNDDEDAELLDGCARCVQYTGRKPRDMFAFLLSSHRSASKSISSRRESFIPSSPTMLSIPSGSSLSSTTSSSYSTGLPSLVTRYRALTSISRNRRQAHVVRASSIHGRGLFAVAGAADDIGNCQPIDIGTIIIEYTGETIRSSLADKREQMYESKGIDCFMFRVDESTVVDATLMGSKARFINHSCEPNCHSKVVTVDGVKHIVIVASRNICAGEEFTYNYKFPVEGVKIPCSCGARKCLKYLN